LDKIAASTYGSRDDFRDITRILDLRLQSTEPYKRRKALEVLKYCMVHGSPGFVAWVKEKLWEIAIMKCDIDMEGNYHSIIHLLIY
jgi:hypothetical protein